MLVTFILIASLLLAAQRGWRRGLFWEILEVSSMIFSAFLATLAYQGVSSFLQKYVTLAIDKSESLAFYDSGILQKVESPLFAAIAFGLTFLFVSVCLRLLMLVLRPIGRKLSFGKLGRAVAALLALIVAYFSLQVLLICLSLVPVSGLQSLLAGSSFAHWVVFDTPLTSHELLQLIVTNTLHITVH